MSLPFRKDLRALVAIANPSDLDEWQSGDRPLAPIDVPAEILRARQALSEIPMTALYRRGQATLQNLVAALREGSNILYLVAHGALTNNEPRLWLEGSDGKAEVVSGKALATEISTITPSRRPILVTLSSCQSAGSGSLDGDGAQSALGPLLLDGDGAQSALGPLLIEAGVPAVLAMQGNVSMEIMKAFMPAFFRELRRDGQVDRAVAVARGVVRDHPDAWRPVLYMRLRDGRLTKPDSYYDGMPEPDLSLVDYTSSLNRLVERFADHMRRFAGAQAKEAPQYRYIPLTLQDTQGHDMRQEGVARQVEEKKAYQTKVLEELVRYPENLLITATAGSGKTTLLLHEARRLALAAKENRNAPFPIYLSLLGFESGNADTLLGMAAAACGISPQVVSFLWRNNRRPIYLLMDDVAEVAANQIPRLLSALQDLQNQAAEGIHTIIVACRPGPLQGHLESSSLKPRRLVLLSLDDSQIDQMLYVYGVSQLAEILDSRMREIVQTPDLLSALAQSAGDIFQAGALTNAGQIYQLLIDKHLFGEDQGPYKYWRVKRPVLARLAYTMQTQDQAYLSFDDAMYDQIADHLQAIEQLFQRRRNVMPAEWNVQELLQELLEEGILAQLPGAAEQIGFPKSVYRDYFAAVYLTGITAGGPEFQGFSPEDKDSRWVRTLIVLLGIAPDPAALIRWLYSRDQLAAIQLWFENRPRQAVAPDVIVDGYTQQAAAIVGSPSLVGPAADYTLQLLVRLLASADPRQRLEGAVALSQ